MFTYDVMIDAVQTGKKTAVGALVTNKAVKDAMIGFIDAQTEYTKTAAKSFQDLVTTMTSESVKSAQDAAKFDYVKFGEGVMRAYQNFGTVGK